MSDFVLHPEAIRDLEDIWDYVASGSLDAADRCLELVYRSIRELTVFPHLGHVRLDLTSRPMRFQVVSNLLIAYVPEEKPLLILAVIDGRRNPRTIAAMLRERS